MELSYFLYLIKGIYRKNCLRLFHIRPASRRYAGKKVLSIEDGNVLLKEKILSGVPYMAARYGMNEISFSADILVKGKSNSIRFRRLLDNAGFFPESEQLAVRFAEYMAEVSKYIDMIALLYSHGEEYAIHKYASASTCVNNRAIEPWYSPNEPWTAALKGKRVLVIHPFEETIRAQYKERDKLFPGTEILPEFELHTIKAVQTIAGQKDERFETWFDALDYMYNEAMKIDFDVAILGCGAYGLPLAAKLKKAGKQAVHLGGATQLLFGIKGARWDKMPHIAKCYNDYWVRPSDEDKPKDAEKVEGGCYW